MQNEVKSLKRYIPILSGILIICLLFSNTFLLKFYLENSQNSIIAISENSKLEFTKLQLETEFQKNLNALNSMRGSNEELNKIINLKQSELLAMKNKLDEELAKNGDINIALSSMESIKKQNLENIRILEVLRSDNAALKVQVRQNEQQIAQLEQTKGQLGSNIDSMKMVEAQQRAKLSQAYQENKNKDELLNNVKETLEKAKFIAVGNLSITPQMLKRGKPQSTEKSRKIDQYNICFTPVANALAQKGKQVFHLQILDIIGEPVSIGDAEIKTEQGSVRSTLPIEVAYEGEAKSHCVAWVPTSKLKPGTYEATLYHTGRAAGSNKFTIK